MIEAQDINDADILSKSRKEQHENGKGTFRFVYDLPNGGKLVSEWLSPEHAKKALMPWCDNVRHAVVQAVEQKQAEKRKLAQKIQSAAIDKVIVNGEAPTARAVDSTVDPCEHAKNQVALLEAEERHWSAEAERATKHLATTRAKLAKWNHIVAAFAAGAENE